MRRRAFLSMMAMLPIALRFHRLLPILDQAGHGMLDEAGAQLYR